MTRFSCYSSDVRNRVWFYQLTVVRGGSDVIVLTAACLESEKAAYLPVFERIVSSFRLIVTGGVPCVEWSIKLFEFERKG